MLIATFTTNMSSTLTMFVKEFITISWSPAVGSVASSLKVRRRARSLRLPDETDSLVRVLLASPASLATMCLARGDCSRAYQVIQVSEELSHDLLLCYTFLLIYRRTSLPAAVWLPRQGSLKSTRKLPLRFASCVSPPVRVLWGTIPSTPVLWVASWSSHPHSR